MREPGPVSAVQSGGTIAATRRTVNQGAQIRVSERSFLVSTMGVLFRFADPTRTAQADS